MRTVILIVLLLVGVVGLQAARERLDPLTLPDGVTGNLLYVRSPEFLTRAALSYDALLADVYWIRTVQHFGRTKLSDAADKQYDLLYPLLDLTTSLDPRFNIAYQFGAIFLAEAFPGGAGRPDLAIALLEKGLKAQPDRWQFAQDLGFVHYWWRQDYARAAEWFQRAADMPRAPNWLAAMAAVTLAQGGNRESSRRLWQEVLGGSGEAEWLRRQAEFRLTQLDAMDQIAALEDLIEAYERQVGSRPRAWLDLVRAGALGGIPIDPERHPYVLDPVAGDVTLSPDSPLNPLPAPEQPRG
jgi:tetratricopeptide (TPR) repeat protein